MRGLCDLAVTSPVAEPAGQREPAPCLRHEVAATFVSRARCRVGMASAVDTKLLQVAAFLHANAIGSPVRGLRTPC
jgi:hypothetical protein